MIRLAVASATGCCAVSARCDRCCATTMCWRLNSTDSQSSERVTRPEDARSARRLRTPSAIPSSGRAFRRRPASVLRCRPATAMNPKLLRRRPRLVARQEHCAAPSRSSKAGMDARPEPPQDRNRAAQKPSRAIRCGPTSLVIFRAGASPASSAGALAASKRGMISPAIPLRRRLGYQRRRRRSRAARMRRNGPTTSIAVNLSPCGSRRQSAVAGAETLNSPPAGDLVESRRRCFWKRAAGAGALHALRALGVRISWISAPAVQPELLRSFPFDKIRSTILCARLAANPDAGDRAFRSSARQGQASHHGGRRQTSRGKLPAQRGMPRGRGFLFNARLRIVGLLRRRTGARRRGGAEVMADECIGWVERSETHLCVCKHDGFRALCDPP